MARAATAFVDFEGDFSRIQRGAGLQSKKLESTFGSSFRRIAGLATAAFAGIGIGKVLKDSFNQAEEAQKVAKLTAAVLKSTGQAANVSAPQVEKMANSLAALSGVDDEVIQSAENVLLTFTQVRNQVGKGNDIFNQGILAATNLSSALGTDLQGAVIQVGKALNDPIKGITALRRVGVSFTKEQIDQVKALVASGHAMDAQKLILHELTTEFGGAAAAAATPSKKLGVAFKNIEESLGGLILPLFEKLASFITKTAAPALERFTAIVKNLGTVAIIAFEIGFSGKNIAGIHGWLSIFAKLGAALRGFIDFLRGDVASAGVQLGKLFGLQEDDPRVKSMIKALTTIRKALVKVVDFVKQHWKPILVVAAAALLLFTAPIVTVVAGLAILYLKFQAVRDIVKIVVDAFQTAREVIGNVIDAIVGFFQGHSKDFAAFGKQFEGIGKSFVGVWNAVVPLVRGVFVLIAGIIAVAIVVIIALWDRFGKTILDKLRIAFNAIAQVVRGALEIVQGIIEIITGIITLKWGKTWEGIKHVFGGVWTGMAGIVKFALNQVSAVIAIGVSAIAGVWKKAWGGFESVVAGVWGGIERVISSAVNRVIDIVNGLIDAFNKLPFIGNIDKIGHVGFGVTAPKGNPTLPGAFNPSGTTKGRSRTPAVSVPTGPTGGRPFNANVVVNGNVFGVDDLNKFADERDRKLVGALAAGHR